MGNEWGSSLLAAHTRAAPLLVVLGSDSDGIVRDGGRSRLVGNSDIFKLLPDGLAFEQLNLSKQFLKQQGRPNLARYDCVLNLITDRDQHPKSLEILRKLLRGFRGSVINHPDALVRTGRDQVAKRLAGTANLRVPVTLRLRVQRPHVLPKAIESSGFAFPAILRRAGTHGGEILGRVESAADAAALAGAPGDYILTEFVDYKSADGLYRKYRAFFIGQRRIFRHLIGADDWNIHAKERFAFMAHHPGLIAEELRIIERPEGDFPERVDATLDAVRERLALDFFGMDFGIAPDGQVVLFEANATMNFFPVRDEPPFAHIARVIEPSRRAFRELLGPAAG